MLRTICFKSCPNLNTLRLKTYWFRCLYSNLHKIKSILVNVILSSTSFANPDNSNDSSPVSAPQPLGHATAPRYQHLCLAIRGDGIKGLRHMKYEKHLSIKTKRPSGREMAGRFLRRWAEKLIRIGADSVTRMKWENVKHISVMSHISPH